MKTNLHIQIARSNVRELSSMNQRSADGIQAVLLRRYTKVGISIINTLDDLEKLVQLWPDLVFVGSKYVIGPTGRKVWVSQYLEAHQIPHTGSPITAIKFEQDKPLAKQRVLDAGLMTAGYLIVVKGEPVLNNTLTLNFPLFVKPTNLGGGKGVDSASIVHNMTELNTKTAALFDEYGVDALVEEYLPGREFSVAVLRKPYRGGMYAMPIEMKPGADVNGNYMLSHALKAGKIETPVTPVFNQTLKSQLCELALNVFAALGGRDYGRIDIRLSSDGVPCFLEANLIPGLIEGSGNFPKACALNRRMNYDATINAIVQLGLQRVKSVNISSISLLVQA